MSDELDQEAGATVQPGNDEPKKEMSKAERKEAAKAKTKEAVNNPDGVAGQKLKSYIERVERLEEEKRNQLEDIRDVYSEVKSVGFEPKIVRKIIKLRRTNLEKRREDQELLDLYMAAIGMAE